MAVTAAVAAAAASELWWRGREGEKGRADREAKREGVKKLLRG